MSPPYNNNITALQMRQLRALRGRPLQIINTSLGELVTYPPRNRCLICRYPVSPPVEVCVCCQSGCWPPINEFFRCPLDARMASAAWCLSMGRKKPDGTIPPFPADRPAAPATTRTGAQGIFSSLRQTGPDRWKGLCPIHQEKTASFYVYRGKDQWRWHCFGACAGGGGIVDLARELKQAGKR
jgi:hypothetical protein